MADRKYITELALNFCSDAVLLLHPKDVSRIDTLDPNVVGVANDCHVYALVTRPRVSFLPGSVHAGDAKTIGRFRYTKAGVVKETDFWLRGNLRPNEKLEVGDYPHNTLVLTRNGERVRSLFAHLCAFKCDHIGESSLRDLRVVYVGMSYTENGRSAKDRLLSHSTLQQVLADLNVNDPDSEALVLMFQYDSPMTFISFDGRDKSLNVENDRDLMGDLKRQQNNLTKDMQIKLIEAGLIRYFQPEYNDRYKNRFPLPTHEILKEVYEIDFGALTVEINTEDINARLFSDTRPPGHHHVGSFDLHDPDVRRSFFNIMNVAGGNAADLSGPAY